ncbi:hypothetical protein DPEC_G00361110 [Dallia pectoralis]|uniref:Uncharacterized protein n=1 Tax=Dallia pectoralis TaxID=75939 RepID=A0ACC2F0Z8_DALPE|nr:hypothetical protein DPEC_G00361110 [Dallia pectoralis]
MSKPAVPHLNLLFLKDYSRVRKFAAHLFDRNFRPTTMKSYLTDANAFVKYVVSMSPEGVKVGHKSLNALLVELRARMRDMARMLLGQQLAHRRKKSNALEKKTEAKKHQRMFFGLLGGYIVAVTGHRKGVLLNLTRAEVKEADKQKNGDRIICVEQHKTARYFCQAAIPLQKREYGWFERYDCLRSWIEGGLDADTFFHTSSGSRCMKLPEYFKQAWESLELGKAPTFNLLRSSVATYVQDTFVSPRTAEVIARRTPSVSIVSGQYLKEMIFHMSTLFSGQAVEMTEGLPDLPACAEEGGSLEEGEDSKGPTETSGDSFELLCGQHGN